MVSDLEYDKLDEESIARAAGFLPESLVRRMNRVNSKKIKSLEAKLKIAIEALEFYSNKENYYNSGYGMKWFAEHGYKRSKLALEKIGGGECSV